jgi:hypothetical protein
MCGATEKSGELTWYPPSSSGMRKKAIKVEIVEETAGRFLVKTYADGTQEREAIVKQPRKKRYPDRPYWVWKFDREKDS